MDLQLRVRSLSSHWCSFGLWSVVVLGVDRLLLHFLRNSTVRLDSIVVLIIDFLASVRSPLIRTLSLSLSF